MAWTMVEVEVVADDADRAADRLWQSGAAGIAERPGERGTILSAGFEDPSVAAAATAALADLGTATAWAVDDDGLDAWRAFAQPQRAGTWWLSPSWLEPPPLGAGERVLVLDPGRTFGSGSHATTRLVVALLDDLVTPGCSVLDVGCGSGVLSVAAAMAGAGHVTAIDVDDQAPGVTDANVARNRVAAAVTASTTPLAAVVADGTTFDLVLANLLAPVIAELADDLCAAVHAGGRLVVSGLLADRWEATTAHLRTVSVERVVEDDGWVAVVLRRSPTLAGWP